MADGDLRRIEQRPSAVAGELGRHLWHDPRNRSFPARGVVFAAEDPVVPRVHWRRVVFDQGGSSACTMFSAAGCLHTSPNRLRLAKAGLLAYDSYDELVMGYLRAQAEDPWDGGEPDYYGSSTDAPFKILRAEGRIAEWRWCFGLEDVLCTLAYHGPVSIGTDWYSGMDEPRGRDAVVEPVGNIRGGHAYEVYAVMPHAKWPGGGYVDCFQSWGDWGPRHGRFRMSWEALGHLLDSQGEACTIVLPEAA
jgi:hypothetical protein